MISPVSIHNMLSEQQFLITSYDLFCKKQLHFDLHFKHHDILKGIIKLSVPGGQMAQHLPLAGLAGIGWGHVGARHSTALQSTMPNSIKVQQKYCRARKIYLHYLEESISFVLK